MENFRVKLERLDPAQLGFDSPQSPFYPYRLDNLDEGLTLAEYLELQQLQEQGDCGWAVYDLAVKGFFGLHPQLIPLLDDAKLGPLAVDLISASDPALVQRCHYFQLKHELKQWYDPAAFEPIDFGSHWELPEPEFSDELRVFAWPEHWHITRMVGVLAFCRDYPPAIRDVLEMTGRDGGLVYSSEEAIFLAARAAYYEVISDDTLIASIEFARTMGMNIYDIMRIYDRALHRPMHEMDPVRGYWYGECRQWFAEQSMK
ncbi:MAG: hypothetical protein ABJH63_03575 [Rhizobiaceae bacterium]